MDVPGPGQVARKYPADTGGVYIIISHLGSHLRDHKRRRLNTAFFGLGHLITDMPVKNIDLVFEQHLGNQLASPFAAYRRFGRTA